MADSMCEIFTSEQVYPGEETLVDGVPKNSLSSLLRVCMDERRERCIYHRRLAVDTDHYEAKIDLCFHAYRKD